MEELNKISKETPECLKMKVVYSRDDEGNGYQTVSFAPSEGFYDGDEFTGKEQFDENEITETANAICVN